MYIPPLPIPEAKWSRDQPFWDEIFKTVVHGRLAGGTQRDRDAESLAQYAFDVADKAIEKRDSSRERRRNIERSKRKND